MGQQTKMIEHLPFETSQMIGSRARIGIVVLATDYTIEHEMRTLVNLPGVDIYHARIPNSPNISPDSLRAMEPLITATAELILPGDTLDVLAYACTSASIVLGTPTVAKNLNAAKPEAKTTNPAFAAFHAFHAFHTFALSFAFALAFAVLGKKSSVLWSPIVQNSFLSLIAIAQIGCFVDVRWDFALKHVCFQARIPQAFKEDID